MKTIYLAGGCFWGVQKHLDSLAGVINTEVGYANGNAEICGGDVTYKKVCGGNAGFAETVRVKFDEIKLPLSFLLEAFYDSIDVTSLNRQGVDVGTQYRSGVYYADSADKTVIEESLSRLSRRLEKEQPGKTVQVECCEIENFYPAEEYHQKYLEKNSCETCGGNSTVEHHSIVKIPTPKSGRNSEIKRVDASLYKAPDAEKLKTILTNEQYAVTQNAATEASFSNEYWDEHRRGIYVDITTGEPLFASADKFESGCGWPSFSRPIDSAVLQARFDDTGGRGRTEILSRVGGAHLGHVFDDGVEELGGLRYCINSASLRFVPIEEMESQGYGAFMDLAE